MHAFAVEPSQVHLELLNGFTLLAGRGRIELPRAAQRLIAFLALQERPVRREFVAGRLWAETTEAARTVRCAPRCGA